MRGTTTGVWSAALLAVGGCGFLQLPDQVARSNRRLDVIAERLETTNVRLANINDQLTGSDGLVATLQRTNRELTQARARIDSAADRLVAVGRDIDRTVEEIRPTLTTGLAEIRKVNERLAAVEDVLADTRPLLETIATQLPDQLDAVNTRLDKLLTEIRETKTELSEAIAKLTAGTQTLERSNEALRSINAQAVPAIQAANEKLERIVERLGTLTGALQKIPGLGGDGGLLPGGGGLLPGGGGGLLPGGGDGGDRGRK